MRYNGTLLAALVLGCVQGCVGEGSDPELTEDGTAGVTASCAVGPPPASLGLDPAYQKYCDAAGLAVVAGVVVNDAAVQQAAEVVRTMLSAMPDVARRLAEKRVRVGVIGEHQALTDMPENRDIYRLVPGTDWNARTRGVGATAQMPLSSAAEENVLCFEVDRYRGESILVHELAHTIKQMGIEVVDPTFKAKTETAYRRALAAGLWQRTYASENAEEYWAEGVQDYFEVNARAVPANGVHNEIHTRTQLRDYDPPLFRLIDQWFKAVRLGTACPAPRFDAGASYRVSNQFLVGRSLDITNDATREPRMSTSANVAGQQWRIADAGRGAHLLTTTFTGSQLALTARNRSLGMQAFTGGTTQQWRVSWASDGAYRLTNVAAGDGLSLDTPDRSDPRPSLQRSATVTGQLWSIERQSR